MVRKTIPVVRGQGSLKVKSDLLGRGKVEKSDNKTCATKKSKVPSGAQGDGGRVILTGVSLWYLQIYRCYLIAMVGNSKKMESQDRNIAWTYISLLDESHEWVLQSCDSLASPLHGAPPFEGGVHVRVLDWVPVPQLAEQVVHWVHSDHLPSTNV